MENSPTRFSDAYSQNMVNSHLHPSQLFHDYWYHGRMTMVQWGINVLSVLALATTPMLPSYETKAFTLMLASISCAMSNQLTAGIEKSKTRMDDVEDLSDVAHTQGLFTGMVKVPNIIPELIPGYGQSSGLVPPGEVLGGTWSPNPNTDVIDVLALVSEHTRHLYPHIMIVGGTGDGKTTLAEWMNDHQGDNVHRLYISPTIDENEFINYRKFGCGVNKEKGVIALDYDSITRIMNFLVEETLARYEMPPSQRNSRGLVDAIVDEFRLVAKVGSMLEAATGRIPTGNGEWVEANYSQLVAFLATVARKVGIRIWLLTQSDRVKALNIEGEGDLRQSFVTIRLRTHARVYLQQLIQDGRYPQESLQWWDSQPDRSVCLVNDKFAFLPVEQLRHFKKRKAEVLGYSPAILSSNVAEFELPYTPDTTNAITTSSAMLTPTVPPLEFEVAEEQMEPEPMNSVPTLNAALHAPYQSSPEIFTDSELTWFAEFLATSEEVGFGKSKILKACGFKGDKYKKGAALWERFLLWRASN